jgi:pimeloyl-ACP methyl ester carboxylesterase
MFSYLLKAWQWLTYNLVLSSPSVQLSRAEERETMVKAIKLLNLIKDHKFVEALENGTTTIKLLVSPSTLEKVFKDLQTSQGPLVSFTPVGVEGCGKKKVAKVLVKFENGELLAVIAIDTAGLIAGFRLKQARDVPSTWKQPGYADPDLFVEEDITLTANKVILGATLSLPKGRPSAGVIFLGGSGPIDRDSTIGPNKPLKDLAWGLASKSIAVCRWDKFSAENSDKITIEEITLSREYLPYFLEAIKELRKKLALTEDVEIPIFVLGHSLGGMVAPMLAAADPSVKGLLLMSAGGGKMYQSAARQIQYLASLNHDPPFATQAFVDLFAKQVAVIESPDFGKTTPVEELPFEAPASYWLSVKEYDQVAAAAALDISIAVLQAGRDYQVTVEDDYEKWKEGLKGKKNVTLKVYGGLNHLFLSGEGPSTPDDYALEEHVDEKVVVDICTWIKEHSRA